MLATQKGVTSFKIFMFYGGYGLHGKAGRDAQRQFLMLDEDDSYDPGPFRVYHALGLTAYAEPTPIWPITYKRQFALRSGRYSQCLY